MTEAVVSGLPVPRAITIRRQRSDRIYRLVCRAAGSTTLVVLVLVGLFLFRKGEPVLRSEGLDFFTSSEFAEAGPYGVAAVLYWTVVIALIGLVFAVPFAVATALYINEYAPRRLRKVLTTLIDLLAAVPSLLYGLWGLFFLQPRMAGVSKWINGHFGFLPIFGSDSDNFKSSSFIAGVVVALMIVPIITSVCREVFSAAPPGEKEAALALGGRRWGMIRTVVLPFGRGGMIGGSMLGLGRALGETIAVVLIISPTFVISPHILESGSNSVASLIALRVADAHGRTINALMAAGLALFLMTLLVNLAASSIVQRSRSGKGVEL